MSIDLSHRPASVSCDVRPVFDAAATDALFAGSIDCVKMLNLDGQLILLNAGGQAALELDHVDQLNGEVWWDLWPEPQARLAADAFAAARRGEVAVFNEACPTVRGTPRRWEVTVSPIRDANGAVERVLVVSRDVTAAALAREALEDAGTRKTEILETVAHELRNPLSAAVSGVELLQRAALSTDEVKRIAAMLNRQLLQISGLTEDLLDCSRIDRGDLRVALQPTDLNAVIGAVVEQLQPAAAKKEQVLDVILSPCACIVAGDHARLVQAVGNLVSNAIRYTPASGKMEIAVAMDERWAIVSVKDSGIGIAAHRLANLFERYVKVDADTARSSAGLGLGLSLVRSIVDLHGGTVAAASPGHGGGSVFTIRLPLLD